MAISSNHANNCASPPQTVTIYGLAKKCCKQVLHFILFFIAIYCHLLPGLFWTFLENLVFRVFANFCEKNMLTILKTCAPF